MKRKQENKECLKKTKLWTLLKIDFYYQMCYPEFIKLLSFKKKKLVVFVLQESTALQGVIITVAKKLAKDQSEYNDIVTSLGGDYRWNSDNSCTHFIFQVLVALGLRTVEGQNGSKCC